MLKLDEFITETLNQIVDGVKGSLKHAEEAGAYINIPVTEDSGNTYLVNSASIPQPQIIAFLT